MSTGSGSSSQVISLPKGGGALHGIGEKFSPDLHTGTGNFTVPITLPPGRSGFQPKIDLVYSTGHGNGPFGFGWALSLPGITRKTSKGIPRYRDHVSNLEELDTFILSGTEDLVPISDPTQSPTLYRPRTEGLFAQIEHHWAEDGNYWIVKSKDGLTSYYGTPKPPHEEKWFDPAVVADPDHPENIFSWKLTRTTDPFDNSIEYLYERERARQAGPHRWDQTYLKAIRYGDYGDRENPQFLVYLRFFYKDRPDPISEYRSGFEIRTTRRCHYIGVYTLADTLRFVRRYDLVYADQLSPSSDWLPKNGVSLLHQVSVAGVEFPVLNRLENGDFSQARAAGSYPESFETKGEVASAAVAWNVRNNEPCAIRTQIIPCEHIHLRRSTMRVQTTGARSGVVHDLSPYSFPWPDVGPKLTAYAWVFVIQGTVGIGIGSGDAIQIVDKHAQSSKTGQWEYLETTGIIRPEELAIYAVTADGADFYVADAGLALAGTNWLCNPDFVLIGSGGPETVLEGKEPDGIAPAAGWSLWNASDATTKATLITPTVDLPACPGGGMAYLSVESQPRAVAGNAEPQKLLGNGLRQQILRGKHLPLCLYVRAWVFVKKGQVSLSVREIEGENGDSATSQKIGEWESLILRVDRSSEKSQGLEVSITSLQEDNDSAQSTEFYVASPLVTELPPNLLLNDNFDRNPSVGPIVTLVERGEIPSAALAWRVKNVVAAKTETEVLPSSNPYGGGRMLRFKTEAKGNDLYQSFSALDQESRELVGSLWICVQRGRVAVRLANESDPNGAEAAKVFLESTGKWAFVPLRNAPAGTERLTITAETDEGAEFLLNLPWVSLASCEERLPPLEFNYTRFEPKKRKYAPLKGELPAASLGNPNLELVDLFGNGLPDILEMNGTVRYWRNLGGGQFDSPRIIREAPAESFVESGVQLIDANGDGRSDLLVTRDGRAGYYPLTFDGRWDPKSYQPYRLAPSFNLEDPEVRLVDLTGDGVTDVVRSGSRFECFFNDPEKGWLPENVKPVPRRQLEEFPDVNFSDPRVKWADMTGDGLQDIVLIHNGRIDYWPNLGRGNWGKRITMRKNPRFEDAGIYSSIGYDPRRILLGDIDGDGVADLIYVGSGHITVWINQSGNGWSEPIIIHGTPPITDQDAVRLADIYGIGTAGILWTYDLNTFRDSAYKFLDLTGGVKPYLLNEINSHIGSITRVEYTSSTQYYLQDQKVRSRNRRPETPLPFPVQVVSRVEVIDELSRGRLTTEYRYHHGYWDGGEREFRGFGMVEQLDTESFENQETASQESPDAFFQKVDQKYFSSPLLTKTWFHQGPAGEEFGEWKELDWSEEYWVGDPQMLRHTESVNEFLKMLPERRVKRDALRTLRGSALRTELYALDGSSRESRPYTVTEYSYGLLEVDKSASGDRRPHIFFPYRSGQRTTQWERGDDPMTQFTFSRYTREDGSIDPYGRLLAQTQIACPRGWKALADKSDAYLTTRSLNDYAEPIELEELPRQSDGEPPKPKKLYYIHDRLARVTHYEVTNNSKADEDNSIVARTVNEILKIADSDPALRIIGQTINFYDKKESSEEELPLGQVGYYGALVKTESLVFTDDMFSKAGISTPYLSSQGNQAWTDEYPQEFRNKHKLPDNASYVFHDSEPYAKGFFTITESRKYDFHNVSGIPRGMVLAKLDPLGHKTSIEYDSPCQLLPIKVTDPIGLKTTAVYDYRNLQPHQVTDPNGTVTTYSYTPLGLLQSTMIGSDTASMYQGDRTRPSVRMDYDFFAFDRSPPSQRQPISVRTRRQIHHDQDLDVSPSERDEIVETREYSDGFGRLLQTRTQGEEVRFGHAVFGGEVLPMDQADEAATKREVTGKKNASEAAPNVVVSGWQRYDNKGRVVEKYEPFFDIGWDYDPPSEAKLGQKATMFYDSRGRAFRTVNPDGSEQCVVYGVPGSKAAPDLTNPFVFEPTPWESYSYDANDNAGRTHSKSSSNYQNHWNTPSSAEVDALGRTIKTTERNGSDRKTDWYVTRSTYDIRGNVLTITDPLGRLAFKHVYDLANRPWRVDSLDAGVRRTVLDAAGNIIEQRDSRDSKGALILHAYDSLSRPILLWARNDGDDPIPPVTLREKLIYGDSPDAGLSTDEQKAGNLLGKLYRHYDEAGRLTFEAYDFKGNLLEKQRQVIADERIKSAFNEGTKSARSLVINWDELIALEGNYRTSMTYDALNRVKTVTYPQDVDDQRKILKPHYNRAGALERVTLDDETYVAYIAYNAKGQRTLIAYGNGVMSRYAYDPKTFRLMRLRTEGYIQLDGLTYRSKEPLLQDFDYQYDLIGNILTIQDRISGCGVRNNPDAINVADPDLALQLAKGDALIRRFTYDPLYRLLSATGRECMDIPFPRPWSEGPLLSRCGYGAGSPGTPTPENARDATGTYLEEYLYDPAGNMVELKHQRNNDPSSKWNRHFGIGGLTSQDWDLEWQAHLNAEDDWPKPPGNRLTHTIFSGLDQPAASQSHFFDDNGNLIKEFNSRHFTWDHADRLIGFADRPNPAADATVEAIYLYDASGQRVKKLTRKGQSNYEVTVYVDGLFEYHRKVTPSEQQENNTLHVMDNQSRIALVRAGKPFEGDSAADKPVLYHLGDHLGSSHLVFGGTSAANANGFVNREEYFPYGQTSFGSFGRKRYRFTGKERDEESGLYYHGARYYAPWVARWVSCDPLIQASRSNSYMYASLSPMCYTDPNGMAEVSSKYLEITIDHIEARKGKQQGSATDPNNLQFMTGSDNYRKQHAPEGERQRFETQSLAEAKEKGELSKAAQQMWSRSFAETKELRDLWNKASKGGSASYDKAQEKFWDMITEAKDPNAILVRDALKEAGITPKPGTSRRFWIDPSMFRIAVEPNANDHVLSNVPPPKLDTSILPNIPPQKPSFNVLPNIPDKLRVQPDQTGKPIIENDPKNSVETFSVHERPTWWHINFSLPTLTAEDVKRSGQVAQTTTAVAAAAMMMVMILLLPVGI